MPYQIRDKALDGIYISGIDYESLSKRYEEMKEYCVTDSHYYGAVLVETKFKKYGFKISFYCSKNKYWSLINDSSKKMIHFLWFGFQIEWLYREELERVVKDHLTEGICKK